MKLIRMTGMVLVLGALGACGATRWEDLDTGGRTVTPDPRAGRISATNEDTSQASDATQPVTVSSLLTDYYRDWRGTPYRFGGTTRDGIDCSAFTQQALGTLGIPLERTTTQQLTQGAPIEAALSRPGDLVFFKTGATLNHVGVIIGPAKFMHASTKNGVTISRLDDSYWSSRVIGYRRVIP